MQSVIYTEARPPAHLHELVHCFWEIKTKAPLSEDFLYHIVPDACVNILFNQMDKKITAITAIHMTSKVLNLGKAFQYVGVQLLPGVWRGSPAEIENGFVNKPYKGKLPLIEINNQLTKFNFSDKQTVLSQLIERLMVEKLIIANHVTMKILKHINDIHNVADMAKIVKLSSRQLQRILNQTIGFTPHDFLKVLRIQQSFKQSYLDYYVDQSHFIHSFRKVTGYTPMKYIKKFDV